MLKFNNLLCYQYSKPFTLNELEAQMQSDFFTACTFNPEGEPRKERYGFVTPHSEIEQLYIRTEGYLLLTIHHEKRIVPRELINRALKREIEKVEEATMAPVKRSDRDSMKAVVEERLVARALPKEGKTYMIWDEANQAVYVSASAASRAESCLALVRRALGSLPVVPKVVDDLCVGTTLARWVTTMDAPAPLELGSKLTLSDLLSHSKGRGIDVDLSEAWVQALADKGYVEALELEWGTLATFTLTDEIAFKSIKWPKEFTADAEIYEDPLIRYQAFTLLYGSTIAKLVNDVVNALEHQEELEPESV